MYYFGLNGLKSKVSGFVSLKSGNAKNCDTQACFFLSISRNTMDLARYIREDQEIMMEHLKRKRAEAELRTILCERKPLE